MNILIGIKTAIRIPLKNHYPLVQWWQPHEASTDLGFSSSSDAFSSLFCINSTCMEVGMDRERRKATCSALVMRLAIFEKSSESGKERRSGADFMPMD